MGIFAGFEGELVQGLGEKSEEVDFYESGYESVNLVGWCFIVWDIMLVWFAYVVVRRNATRPLRLHGGVRRAPAAAVSKDRDVTVVTGCA